MAAVQLTPVQASLYDSRSDSGDDSEVEDLYVGTSTGASYRNLGGARPLTVASLLENKVVFVPQERTTPLDEIPYVPINIAVQPAAPVSISPAASAPAQSTAAPNSLPKAAHKAPARGALVFASIDPAVGWAKPYQVGPGLDNVGNTCFLNSALQVLLHTPPLVRYLDEGHHDFATCPLRLKTGFCASCAMAQCVKQSFRVRPQHYIPRNVTNHLKNIAKTLRAGRQEDSHEFLRFFIDGMQKGELFGKDKKLTQEAKDSSWVHQIFGGRLRSRVTCGDCGHPSDTFDSMLDLSLDVQRAKSLKDALGSFVHVDKLRGANKYKCEKCKKLVNADKSFTIHEAPLVLMVHLKRFTAGGRKIGDTINYPDQLSLGPFMSSRSATGPTYRLYGVVLHSGSGPHSGHYTAYVKSSAGRWHHMNDSDVTSMPDGKAPVNAKSAYILFYCREKGDALNAAINAVASTSAARPNGSSLTNGKRPRDSLDGNGFKPSGAGWTQSDAPPAKKAFIGPVIPGKAPPTVATASTASASPKFVSPFGKNANGNGSPGTSMLTNKQRRRPTQIPTSGAIVAKMKGRAQGILTS